MIDTLTNKIHVIRALRSRSFALLWSSQVISQLGDGTFTVALAWLVLRMTGSGTAMGIVLVASNTPRVLFLLVGGVIADRLPKQFVLLWSDAGRACAVLLIAGLGWLHLLQFWHLLILSLFFGIAQGFFLPAYQAIPPQLVKKEELPSANALTELSEQIGRLLGPLLGAICVAISGPESAFAIDGLTFIVSALCFLLISSSARLAPTRNDHGQEEEKETREEPSTKRGIQSVVVDMREGLGYVLHSPWLWITILTASLSNIGLSGPLQVALPRLVQDVEKAGVWLLGGVGTATGIGAIIGTLFIGQARHLRKRGLIAYFGLMLAGFGLTLFGLPVPAGINNGIALLGGTLVGLGLGVLNTIWMILLQELVPAEKLGRVFSIAAFGAYSCLPVGLALVGIATDHFGPVLVFIISGLLNILLAAVGLSTRSIRQLD